MINSDLFSFQVKVLMAISLLRILLLVQAPVLIHLSLSVAMRRLHKEVDQTHSTQVRYLKYIVACGVYPSFSTSCTYPSDCLVTVPVFTVHVSHNLFVFTQASECDARTPNAEISVSTHGIKMY